jgi:glycosyltransferase involved in cell wall biosynthesis
LACLLDGLTKQNINPFSNWNVIVVNNNCSDRTDDVIVKYQKAIQISYLREDRQGKTFALNKAISSSDSELFLLTDDDVIVPDNWIHDYQCAATYQKSCEWFGGIVRPNWNIVPDWLHEDTLPALDGYFGRYSLGSYSRLYRDGDKLPLGASLAIRRNVFEKIGVFREDLGPRGDLRGTGDETELLQRAIRAGMGGYYLASNPCLHDVPQERLKLRAFYRYGIGKGINQYRLEGKRHRSGSDKIIVDQAIRGLYQLLKGRKDRARICVVNIGMEIGRRRESKLTYEIS